MAVVATWDGANRRIYLHVDTFNAEWSPVDLYREYRIERRTNESFRVYEPLLRLEGNIAKTLTTFTERYMTLLGGTKIVPYDAQGFTRITGEIITDDQTSVFDLTTLVNPMVVIPAASNAEIITVATGSGVTAQDKIDIADLSRDTLLATESFP